ncbi:amino acid aminotransferase [Sphingobium subterraneum]|uniref:Aminotransferase n=1 Tax=Sphingobium subterraneum TaxID=627688 RepID=A0A841IZ89_9SPHN|nr:amino acid aminotransferase [Sphingobium subterraneum]MBB6123442.1 aromatic-amino-acid transaminase [Sphingobium subterraneum]
MSTDLLLERPSPFSSLQPQPADALLALIAMYAADTRPDKIDLGIGVYRDEAGNTPVPPSVKAAERLLLESQDSKSYLGTEGDMRLLDLLAQLVFGPAATPGHHLAAVQTPGGTGALRLGAALLARANPSAQIWLGTPGWPNHALIFGNTGMPVRTWRYYDPQSMRADFEGTLEALNQAQPGDAVLLQACCHNPTGTSLTLRQWDELASFLAERRLIPFVDLAYQGLGDGLEKDAEGLRSILAESPSALVAYSCSKNFGLYRERVGVLWVLHNDAHELDLARGNMVSLARATWSMPPDHGAATVRIILETEALKAQWVQDLEEMRARLSWVRSELATAHPEFAPLGDQRGMFSTLPISPATVRELREKHGIFMPESGRINLAGLNRHSIDRFAAIMLPYIRSAGSSFQNIKGTQ